MMHNASSVVGENGALAGRRQEWPLGTAGLSAGTHLEMPHAAEKLVVSENMRQCLIKYWRWARESLKIPKNILGFSFSSQLQTLVKHV